MAKSLAQYEIEVEKIAEWLFNNRSDSITNQDNFAQVFKAEILDDKEPSGITRQLQEASLERFNKFKDISDKVDSPEETFRKAGGKNLAQDRRRNAKIITKDGEQFIRLGANRSDLEGLDTKPTQVAASVKGKIVKATPQAITRGKKVITVYRNSRGQFSKR